MIALEISAIKSRELVVMSWLVDVNLSGVLIVRERSMAYGVIWVFLICGI